MAVEADKGEEVRLRESIVENTTHGVATSLPELIKWVQVKCRNSGDEDHCKCLKDYLVGYPITEDILKIMVQEYIAYDEVQLQAAEYSQYCVMMKKKIRDILHEEVANKEISWFLKSRILGLDSGGLEASIVCLSTAIESLVGESHELAVAYCFRAFCTQELDLQSQRVLEDINAAIGIWLNIPVEMLPKCLLILLYHLLDWLSVKGCQEVESIYKIIIRLFDVHKIEKKWLGMLWGSRRTTHALCASPVTEAFLKMLSEHYGEISNSTSFWLDHLKACHQLGGIATGFEQFCTQSNQNDVVQSYHLLRQSDKHFSRHTAAYLLYDLSERLVEKGNIIEALSYANRAFSMRWFLFQETFHKEENEKKKTIWNTLQVRRSCFSDAWSYDSMDFDLEDWYCSPWKIAESFLESLLQLGKIRELNGNITGAIAAIETGRNICTNRFPLLRLTFSSVLGGLYCKQQRLDKAKSNFEEDILAFKSINEFPCTKCKLRLEATIFQNPLLFFDNTKTTKAASFVNLSEVKEWSAVARAAVNDSEWKNYVSCRDTSSHLQCNEACICKNLGGCWHCLHTEVIKSKSVINIIHVRWELVRRCLSLRLYAGLGMLLMASNNQILDIDGISVLDAILKSMSVLVCRDAFSDTISSKLFLKIMGKENAGYCLPVELGELIYNMCWWSLQARSVVTSKSYLSALRDHGLCPDLESLALWLLLAFMISREVPVLFRKVSKLLAALFSLKYVSGHSDKHLSLSSLQNFGSCTSDQWAAYFHQVSLGSDVPGSIQTMLAPDKIDDLAKFVTDFFDGLPAGTPVICISLFGGSYTTLLRQLLSSPSSHQAWILVTRLKLNCKPITMFLPISEIIQGQGRDWDEEAAKKWVCRWGLQGSTGIDDIIPEYRIIMEGLHLSEPGGINLISLNRRLEQFVKKLETVWFGSSKYVLLGEWSSCNFVKWANEKLCKKLEKRLKDKRPTNTDLKVLIGTSTDALEKKTFLSQLYSNGIKGLTAWGLKQLQEEVRRLERIKPDLEREPIILVLDPEIQMLPVEHMPILRGQEVYRMPSVTSISETMEKNQYRKRQVGSSEIPCVDPYDAFMLINPDTTLPLCGDYLEWSLKDRGLEIYKGGEVPPSERFAELLGNKDIYIYMGHNSGLEFVPLKLVEKLKKCSMTCLMGCGSGSSKLNGCFAPSNTAVSYLHAGAPLVICNLWEVLTGENTRFLQRMMNGWWIERSNPRGRSMASYMVKAREGCSLTYVDGAQICYGVPTGISERDISPQ